MQHGTHVAFLSFSHFLKKDTKDYIIFALKRNRTENFVRIGIFRVE